MKKEGEKIDKIPIVDSRWKTYMFITLFFKLFLMFDNIYNK